MKALQKLYNESFMKALQKLYKKAACSHVFKRTS